MNGPTAKPITRVHIRWMIRRDMPEVLAIDAASYPERWGEETFLTHLRNHSTIGMVAELGETVVGFMLYELHKSSIGLIRFAVAPVRRYEGVGRQMTDKLAGKLASHHRTRIVCEVDERLTAGHLFLGRVGYVATRIVPGDDHDDYRFVYRFMDEG
jgi:[ribosomal protein S18]-alanine N-acetyltransferase